MYTYLTDLILEINISILKKQLFFVPLIKHNVLQAFSYLLSHLNTKAMKTQISYSKKIIYAFFFLCVTTLIAQENKEINGSISDSKTAKKLALVSIQVENSNIGTVSNLEGEFILKIPDTYANNNVIISLIGYDDQIIPIADLSKAINKIALVPSSINLSEVQITSFKNAEDLVRAVFDKKQENYSNERTIMTSFYRETIKKRKKNVSLSEAVVSLYKQPYGKSQRDFMKLLRSRKSTDYTKLDTIALKLQGGPYNTLYIDVMKYPEYIFVPESLNNYDFSFGRPTEINGDGVYTVNFKQKDFISDPLYYGTLYISSSSFALVRAQYNLNVSDKVEASKLFVRKKPADVNVQPEVINYQVDYRNKGNKWYYGYGKASLTFRVKKRRKLFSSIYNLTCEMAVTDWKESSSQEEWSKAGNIRKSIILTDEASGFSDPEFWGDYNVIEPEKSIESAIRKIKKKLDKISESSGKATYGSRP